LLNESLVRYLERKNVVLLARVCSYLAETALWEGELDEATHWLDQSLAYYADPRWNTIDQIERLYLAARLAAAQAADERAAILFGLADGVGSHIHYVPAEPARSLIERARATACEALGATGFAKAFAVVQHLSLDEAYTTLLTPTAIALHTDKDRHTHRHKPRRRS
jgi:hypothetical protein